MGVGKEYSDLLEEVGVDTIVELTPRNSDNLVTKIIEIIEEKKLGRRPPTMESVKNWLEQAKGLPRKVEY